MNLGCLVVLECKEIVKNTPGWGMLKRPGGNLEMSQLSKLKQFEQNKVVLDYSLL